LSRLDPWTRLLTRKGIPVRKSPSPSPLLLHFSALVVFGLWLVPPVQAQVVVPDGFVDLTLVTGLAEPNSMAFLPDGRLLFTEQRTGRVRMVVGGTSIATHDPVLAVTQHSVGGERGLQGIAVDPGWPARPYVYVYYTHDGDQCWLVRFTGSGDLDNPLGHNLTLDSPLVLIDDIPDANQAHNAGCLRFGPDGRLYVTLGEDFDHCAAADSTTLKGALLRLDVGRLPAGSGGPVPRALLIPGDNPLSTSDSNAMLVWAYGMRNPWRFHFDPVLGEIYGADVGVSGFEEINEIRPGDFLGWPWREGDYLLNREDCPEPGGANTNAFVQPIVSLPHGPGLAAINCAGMYRPVAGAPYNWPSEYSGFYGDVFLGEYYSGILRRIKKQSGVWGAAPPVSGQPTPDDWATGLVTAVDFLIGPEGSMWWLRQYDESFSLESGSLHVIRSYGSPVGVGHGALAIQLTAGPALFRSSTDLAFSLETPGRVRLTVYDVAGRVVRRLADEEREAGPVRRTWTGEDDGGRPVPAGVYLVRLEAPGRRDRARLVRLR
jgi:glucose/arabinose dehydrogenase